MEAPTNGASKFKSAINADVKGVTDRGLDWRQPLKRHVNPETGQTEFVTILVRVLNGDAGTKLIFNEKKRT
jgi:hypothetical protein